MLRKLFVALFFCLVLVPVDSQAQKTVIKAGKVIDPESGRTELNQVIVVEKGKITAMGGELAIPADATVIDLSRLTVLPGLFDAHTHLCMTVQKQRDNGKYYYTTLNDPDSFRAIGGVANARAMLESGFTTVRDVGNEGNYACSSLRRAIQTGLVPGPTILNAGRIIAPFGGQFQMQPDKPRLGEPEYFYADTRDEIIKGIRENVHYGAQLIKIVVDDQKYIYSVDDIRFIIAEAGRAGMKVAAHCWTRAGAHNAALAGVASIEHGFDMSDEDLKLAKKNNVVLVGTEYLALSIPGTHDRWVDRLRRAYKLGVPIVYGSDAIDAQAGQTRGTLAMSGIDPWIEAGVPVPALLKAMTIDAARLLGIDKDRGLLRVGMAADIIATRESPIENKEALKHVAFVMKDGVVFKRVE